MLAMKFPHEILL